MGDSARIWGKVFPAMELAPCRAAVAWLDGSWITPLPGSSPRQREQGPHPCRERKRRARTRARVRARGAAAEQQWRAVNAGGRLSLERGRRRERSGRRRLGFFSEEAAQLPFPIGVLRRLRRVDQRRDSLLATGRGPQLPGLLLLAPGLALLEPVRQPGEQHNHREDEQALPTGGKAWHGKCLQVRRARSAFNHFDFGF